MASRAQRHDGLHAETGRGDCQLGTLSIPVADQLQGRVPSGPFHVQATGVLGLTCNKTATKIII